MQAPLLFLPAVVCAFFVGLFYTKALRWIRSLCARQSTGRTDLHDLHIGIIMDGNRRWAKARGLPVAEGHRRGAKTVEEITKFCAAQGLSQLTLYALSIENLNRAEGEKNALFGLAEQMFQDWKNKADEQNIQIRVFGDSNLYPKRLADKIAECQDRTINNSGLKLNILFCYGGQQEIVHATKKLCEQIASGQISPKDVDSQKFRAALWTGNLPDPDLVIRTGARTRLSNFLTFGAAYSEINFSECLWPDFTKPDLELAIKKFMAATRTRGH